MPDRPRRFIVLPLHRPNAEPPAPHEALRLLWSDDEAPDEGRASAPRTAGARVGMAGLTVVARSPVDGSLLVEPHGAATAETLLSRSGLSVKVVEERWYSLDRPARPWARQVAALRKPRVHAATAVTWTVTVVLDAPVRRRLPDALVTAMVDEASGTGLEATTDRFGRARFVLGASVRSLQTVYVDPLHTGWPARVTQVRVDAGELVIAVRPIDLASPDVRGIVYGPPAPGRGSGVRVAVVDTGVGPHDGLSVTRGLNTTVGESSRRLRDENGHGTHVAGVIAANADAWRAGEAVGVELHGYRVFEARDPYASSFAIASAIKDAAVSGCDLINLSLGGNEADAGIRDAVRFAWERGSVCVAATGNDGEGQVDYPARYPETVAVSAIGLLGSWPDGAFLDWTVGQVRGKSIAGLASFPASFSNHGQKVTLTAPGVGVVSTIPGDRWGVMSGTSMATPIATGVLARRLAGAPAVRTLPRDAARAAAIVALAAAAAEDIDLPVGMQGKGLVR